MNQTIISWLLVYLGLIFVLLELFIGIETGFDLVLIGIALMIGGGAGNWMGSWEVGVATATIITILYIIFGRQFVKSKLKVQTKSTNIESLIGKRGVVTKEIAPHRAGQIKVNSELWRAISNKKIAPKTEVIIEEIHGVTAQVI